MRHALTSEGWRKIRVHYGQSDEAPSCIILIEPISEEQPVVMDAGLLVGLRETAHPVAGPGTQPVNADDDVPDELKAAYGEYDYP